LAALLPAACAAPVLPMRRFQTYDGPLRPSAETARLCAMLVTLDGAAPRMAEAPQKYVACVDVLPGNHAARIECIRGSHVISHVPITVEWTAEAGKSYAPHCQPVGEGRVLDGGSMREVQYTATIQPCAQCPPASEATAEASVPARYVPAPARGESATIYVYRYGVVPLARAPDLFVDDVKVLEPAENGYAWVQLPPGAHRVRIKWSFDIPKPVVEFDLMVAARESYFIRISDGPVLQPETQPAYPWFPRVKELAKGVDLVEPADAQAEVDHCCEYAGPKLHPLLPPPHQRK
jgi:hypothetical protein